MGSTTGADGSQLDPGLLRALREGIGGRGLSRRRFLQGVGAGGAAVAAGSFLSACGTAGTAGTPSAEPTVEDRSDTDKTVAFDNWPLYIDVDEENPNKRPTLDQFTAATGVAVTYTESINDNDEYFAKISPQLRSGQAIAADVFVVTEWLCARLMRLGWVQKLDHTVMPNVLANIDPALANPGFDPGRAHTVPWQSGMTGIAYNPKATGGAKPSSIKDLFDPRFKGRVTMFSGLRESLPLLLLANGSPLATFTEDDVQQAFDLMQKQVDANQVRRFTGNDYTADLIKGDVAICLAYSGDIFQVQLDNPDIEFVIPDEGAEIWSDAMVVPIRSPHKRNAELLMDHYYQPKVAAELAAWVNYVCPVPGAKEAIKEIDPELATAPLIFPDDKTLARTQISREITEDEETRWQNQWQQIVGA